MAQSQGQMDLVGELVLLVILVTLGFIGIFLFSNLVQMGPLSVSASNPFFGTGNSWLERDAKALVKIIGGAGIGFLHFCIYC